MKKTEFKFYQKVKNWDFSMIKRESESLTNWDMYEILHANANQNSIVLDLGTGGGEKVLKCFPKAKEIIATDFSPGMIDTAISNLANSSRKNENIRFEVMDNLHMTVPKNHFDIIVARHTVIDAGQIFQALKNDGILILRGVDRLDCWSLKKLFGRGQAFHDNKAVSLIDYENILDAGFKDVELVPIYEREFIKTRQDFLALLHKVPILDDMSEEGDNQTYSKEDIDEQILDKYITENTYEKGILLRRRYYGITAKKTKK